jgi:serine/threonine protein kinase
LDLSQTRFYLKQIVEAIHHCHRFKVVHRDLKPDNIIFTKSMDLKLIDFGLSNMIVKTNKVQGVVLVMGRR